MLPVSVLIPAYNAANVLQRALESVFRQTLAGVEAVVIDDGSTDETGRIAAAYGPRVRYVRQANAGVSAARNRGLQVAVGEWIAFLDADDEWLPHKLEYQIRILQNHPDLKWCACNLEHVRHDAIRPAQVPPALKYALSGDSVVQFFAAAAQQLSFQTSGFIVHRSIFREVGGFDPSMKVSEDRDMWWRIALRYPSVGYCADVCYRFYCNTPESLMKQTTDRTQSLRAVCANARRAQVLDPLASRTFRAFARPLALDYLLRAAARDVTIQSDAMVEARRLFPPSASDRLWLALLSHMPPRLARWTLGHLRRRRGDAVDAGPVAV